MKLEELECVKDTVDLDEYIKIREEVKSTMEHPEWLGDFTKEEITFIINNGGGLWMYYYNNDPVCSMMLIPANEKTISKFNLSYTPDEITSYGPEFVMPKYRGNKLQYQMLMYLDEYCKNLGYSYAAGTVHPDNTFSINNLIKDDFEMIGFKEFTRGPRNIYLKRFK
jgi:GNAT superfamily N-acetyltransferase